jgi:hypothetical protein
VGGHQDRHAVAAQRVDPLPEVVAALGIEADGRLVEHQEVGGVHQGPGELEAAPHPTREGSQRPVGGGAEPRPVECALDRGCDRSARKAVEGGVDPQVLRRGQPLVDGGVLKDDADAGPDALRLAADVGADDAGFAPVWGEERRQDADQRRLAGAVRAEERKELALSAS